MHGLSHFLGLTTDKEVGSTVSMAIEHRLSSSSKRSKAWSRDSPTVMAPSLATRSASRQSSYSRGKTRARPEYGDGMYRAGHEALRQVFLQAGHDVPPVEFLLRRNATVRKDVLVKGLF